MKLIIIMENIIMVNMPRTDNNYFVITFYIISGQFDHLAVNPVKLENLSKEV